MKYTPDEVMQFVAEEDVKFVRLAFCDVYGKQRNIAVMADELPRAFAQGIAFDASAIEGFGGGVKSDLFLHPDASTLQQLPWRPQQGKVVHMFCDITYPDGRPFEADTRYILKTAVEQARKAGYSFSFGSEIEFYLFRLDENGDPTRIPYDRAGYMDIAPEDKGENVRREVCLTLELMGICPESSHHESGPGQNEIDFRYADPLAAADNAITFRAVVRTIASQSGLYADFSPRPLPDHEGSGMHINLSARYNGEAVEPKHLVAGVLDKIRELTLFLNPCENSYERLGRDKAPAYATWSEQNRSQLIRIPAAFGEYRRAELRSPDPMANPYLAFALLIYACLDGLERGAALLPEADFNAYSASLQQLSGYKKLPTSLAEAYTAASQSDFVRKHIPAPVIEAYGR